MNRIEAHNLLDLARAGGSATESQITEALGATGDLSHAPALEPQAVEASTEWPYYANRAPARAVGVQG